MNCAESLINALAAHGVDACFANPGTSEMQLVAALEKQPGIRAVLCLFEGVATGAADGYGRMAGKAALNEAFADATAQKRPCLIEVML